MNDADVKHIVQYLDAITFRDFESESFKNKSSTQWFLPSLKSVNLFIGGNNSGKSRLIRTLFGKELLMKSNEHSIHELASKIEYQIDGIKFSKYDSYKNWSPIISELKDKINNHEPIYDYEYLSDISKFIESSLHSNIIPTSGPHKIKEKRESDHSEIFNILLKDIVEEPGLRLALNSEYNFRKIYIPILRGLRPLYKIDQENDDDVIFKKSNELSDLNLIRTQSDYNLSFDNNTSQNIFTGFSIFNDLQRLYLGGHDSKNIISNYESFLSLYFFDNQNVSLSPIEKKDVVYIKIGEQKERPIYELGDGLQTIIILTFPIFTAKHPTLFFIEEPETHLHASLQRALIEIMGNTKQHMYFITTHSNHFIDMAQERSDVGIQRVFQEQQNDSVFFTCVDSLAKDTEVLDDLGVRASSVLLANCSIWVEGVTDKLYLRAYMKKYIDGLKSEHKEEANKLSSFKENLHYIFTEYQGSNITHWYFGNNENTEDETTAAPKLCAKAFLIADGDIQSKGTRVQELEQDLGNSFLLLPYKEIENYIPEDILKAATTELWDTFNLKEKATFNPVAILQNDYGNDTGIGRYLEGFVNNHPTERRFFADKSGTIKDKVKLCRISVRLMNESEDWELTPEIKDICKKIFKHIEKSNHI
jgi:AAA domain, putative AbiEii toxin, Type IV TA system